MRGMPYSPAPITRIRHCQVEDGNREISSTSRIGIDPACKSVGNIGHVTWRRSIAVTQITVWRDRTGIVNASGGIDVSAFVDALDEAVAVRRTLCSVLHHAEDALSLVFRVE